MTSIAIRQKLHQYIDTAPASKVKAMLTLLEDESTEEYDKWNDPAFVAEMQSRTDDFLSGKDKGFTHEEAIASARKAVAKIKK